MANGVFMGCLQKIVLFALFLLFSAGIQRATAQSYAEDTVWTKKTDQSEGFWMVKFSDTDSIIAAHGYNDVLFFDSFTGNEIKRLSSENEIYFIDEDKNFLQVSDDGAKLEEFSFDKLKVMSSFENDSAKIYPISTISNDKKYFASIVQGGIRIWDITTKKILKTKLFKLEENLSKFNIEQIIFTCDNQKLLCTEYKEYIDNDNPEKSYTTLNHVLYDFLTLDSIDSFKGMSYFRISNNCQKIAFKRADPTYGVEIYDFNTKELIWKIPINGPSLTGIEFSPDDKYLVTAPTIQIWDILSKQMVKSYQSGSSRNIAISHDRKYIISSIGRYFYKWYARWEGTSVNEPEHSPLIIYPNPTNGLINLEFNNPILENTLINLNDINGLLIKNLYNNILEQGQQVINFNVSDLSNGTYYIKVNNSQLSLFFKLIINK